jgi:SAM-dependent methyltransferase
MLRKRRGLRITYELLDDRSRVEGNCCGTHLNESGDTRPVEEYVKTFDLEKEIQRDDVTDNLLFIDQVIVPLLPRAATVVDVGCGIGRYARFLRRPHAPTREWRYIGVERSEEITLRVTRLSRVPIALLT